MTGAAILHTAPPASGASATVAAAPRPERSFAEVLGDAAPTQRSQSPAAPTKTSPAPPAKLHPIVKADPVEAIPAAIPAPASPAPTPAAPVAKPAPTATKAAKPDDVALVIPTEVTVATPAPAAPPAAPTPPATTPIKSTLPLSTSASATESVAVTDAADSEAEAAPAPSAAPDDQTIDHDLPIVALAADASSITSAPASVPTDTPPSSVGSTAATPVLAPGLAATASDAATAATEQTQGNPPPAAAPPPAPVIQVATLLRHAAPDQNQVFIMQLKPDRLGTVEVRLDIDSKGHATASFVADRPETVQLLQQDQHHLVQALKQAGVAADPGALSFALKDGSTGSGGNGKQTASGRSNFRGFSGQATAEIETQAQPAAPGRRLYDLHA